MRFWIFCKGNKIMPSNCRVRFCQPDFSPSSSPLSLLHAICEVFSNTEMIFCSRCLLEEPNYPWLVFRRRKPTAHTDSRGGETGLPWKVDPGFGINTPERSRTACPTSPEDPPAWLPRALAEFLGYHPPVVRHQRCKLGLCWSAVFAGHLPCV